MRVVDLSKVKVDSVVSSARLAILNKLGEKRIGPKVLFNDMARLSVINNLCADAKSILDVGVGHAVFPDALSRTAGRRVVGVDIQAYDKADSEGRWDFVLVDGLKLPFADGEFDVVTALEVIEHQKDDMFYPMLRELRRVTARKLILSVPYEEPVPLYKGHYQRFTEQRLKDLFHGAKITKLLKKPPRRSDWVVIEEEVRP